MDGEQRELLNRMTRGKRSFFYLYILNRSFRLNAYIAVIHFVLIFQSILPLLQYSFYDIACTGSGCLLTWSGTIKALCWWPPFNAEPKKFENSIRSTSNVICSITGREQRTNSWQVPESYNLFLNSLFSFCRHQEMFKWHSINMQSQNFKVRKNFSYSFIWYHNKFQKLVIIFFVHVHCCCCDNSFHPWKVDT